MPRLLRRPPKYCHHKGTNRASVYIGGKVHYLGVYNSPESIAAYKALVGEWAGAQTSHKPVTAPAENGQPFTPDTAPVIAPRRLTIAEAVVEFQAHAKRYYGPSRETDNLREAIRPVREQFGYLPMADFGPLQLRVMRNKWIDEGLARNTINARVIRLKRFFRWAVSHELIDANVLARLDAVESLMPGRGGKEIRPKAPVTWEKVEATLPHLPEMVRAMVLFGWHSGARPAEITTLTTKDVQEATGYPVADVWVVKLDKHKTALYGHTREILVSRTAQTILNRWLRSEAPDKPIFSPLRVDDRQPRRKGKRPPGETYSRAAFQQVVRRACRRGGIPEWSPNMLRHAFATRLRESAGIEAAQMALGHAKPDTSLIYTAAAKKRAIEAVREMG
jgi:integrase